MTEPRDETHDNIDRLTGQLTPEALARRRELMPDVPAGAADWGWRYDQMLRHKASEQSEVADAKPVEPEASASGEAKEPAAEPGLSQ